jgi:PAS domain-containing protein
LTSTSDIETGATRTTKSRKPDTKGSEHAENRLAALLNATPDAVVLIDGNGIIETFNPGAEQRLRLPGRRDRRPERRALMPAPFRAEPRRLHRRYQQTGEARFMLAPREVEAAARTARFFRPRSRSARSGEGSCELHRHHSRHQRARVAAEAACTRSRRTC